MMNHLRLFKKEESSVFKSSLKLKRQLQEKQRPFFQIFRFNIILN
jgi:hypothetical protein